MADTYRSIWKKLRALDENILRRAANFYEHAPTGQYDVEAALCIRAVILQIQRDNEVKRNYR